MGDFSSPIDAALAVRHPIDFMLAVAALDERYAGEPFPDRPDPLGMLGGLGVLHSHVEAYGIEKFLAEPEGAAFDQTLAWCERVGAEETADFLREVAALYPDGEVPTDDGERYVVLEELQSVRPRPLRQLARRYAGAMDELADRMRDWLRAHRAEVERALEAESRDAPPRRPKPTSRTSTAPSPFS
jgi:hypothetical protein